MARLIRSEKEVEGRYEEVWTLVEEDALVQWPAGPGAVVGRDAPRVDGYELMRRIRRSGTGRLRNIPSIALTAFARPEDAEKARAAVFERHLAKPVEPATLFACVVEVTGRPAAAAPLESMPAATLR